MPTQSEIGAKIVEVASRVVGLYETKANAEWYDPTSPDHFRAARAFEQALAGVGWKEGWAYCMSACEAWWRAAYTELKVPRFLLENIAQLLCPSVMSSFAQVKNKIALIPVPGAIFFMQKGNTDFGHAGIVVRYNPETETFSTIEANTSSDPAAGEASQREGEGIYRRIRRRDFAKKTKGLWLRGFLNPITF